MRVTMRSREWKFKWGIKRIYGLARGAGAGQTLGKSPGRIPPRGSPWVDLREERDPAKFRKVLNEELPLTTFPWPVRVVLLDQSKVCFPCGGSGQEFLVSGTSVYAVGYGVMAKRGDHELTTRGHPRLMQF
jgi:hypothetical protein